MNALKDFVENLVNSGVLRDDPTEGKIVYEINQALPRKYIIIETEKVAHRFVANSIQTRDPVDTTDFCEQCGLYLTDPIHIRELNLLKGE